MITRAHIRRQLRASGGITNVVPREGYILGDIVRGAKKAVKKIVNVGKQVIKSPIGKAALIGLGGAGLMGMGPLSGLGGIGARIGGGLGTLKTGLLGTAAGSAAGPFAYLQGAQKFTPGLLGKLGLTKGGGSMGLTGLGKMLGAGGLIGYFVSKGASEEEAKELAQDVRRGEGIGFDQIRADLNKYRSGDLSQSQMFDKNYRFLTPRNFVAARGGRVGLQEGSSAMNKENVKQKFVSDEAGAIPKKGGGVLPSDIGKLRRSDFDTDEDYQRYLRQLNRKAMGGIMNMPMGNMRRNRAGVMERDYRDEGGFVPVGVKEKADDVPAMLSKNEFVMTADAVRGAGDGNIKKGAQRMYDLMKRNESKVV